MSDSAPRYPTIEDVIGATPMVRLVRVPGADNAARGNVLLGKLEGNNPAGSVKDRPAISMIRRAEERGLVRFEAGDDGAHLGRIRRRFVGGGDAARERRECGQRNACAAPRCGVNPRERGNGSGGQDATHGGLRWRDSSMSACTRRARVRGNFRTAGRQRRPNGAWPRQ